MSLSLLCRSQSLLLLELLLLLHPLLCPSRLLVSPLVRSRPLLLASLSAKWKFAAPSVALLHLLLALAFSLLLLLFVLLLLEKLLLVSQLLLALLVPKLLNKPLLLEKLLLKPLLFLLLLVDLLA